MTTINLWSSDGKKFTTDIQLARQIPFIKDLLENFGEEHEIPLATVESNVLQIILKWCEHHKDDPIRPNERESLNEVPEWDAELLKVDQPTLIGIISAAKYLGIDNLHQYACKTVANTMEGLTPEQIRTKYNLSDDLLPPNNEA